MAMFRWVPKQETTEHQCSNNFDVHQHKNTEAVTLNTGSNLKTLNLRGPAAKMMTPT